MKPRHTGRLLLTPADPWLAVDPQVLRANLEDLGFIGQPLPADAVPGGALTLPPAPSRGFLIGERFFNLLTFAGCAVNLRLTPGAKGEPFTHVHLVGPLASPLLLRGGNTRPPRCPSCRAPNPALSAFADQCPDPRPVLVTDGAQDSDRERDLERERQRGMNPQYFSLSGTDGAPDSYQDLDVDPYVDVDPGREIPCPTCGARHPLWTWDWKGKAGFGRSFVWVEEVFPGEAEPTPKFQAALTSLTASPWRHCGVQD